MDRVRVSCEPKDFDLDFFCREIAASYWAHGRSREAVLTSLENSLGFALLEGDKQIGCARVVTDYSTFAYLCDVIILPERRGRGYAKLLMETILTHPKLGAVKWILRTKDAHGLYEKFGFTRTHRPERYMEKLE